MRQRVKERADVQRIYILLGLGEAANESFETDSSIVDAYDENTPVDCLATS